MERAIILSAFVWVELCAAAQQPRFDGKTWWHHVEVLAADNMEGRATGSTGLQRAEAYVVDQMQRSGLVPAGTDGYYQLIKLETREIVEKDSSAALVRNGKAESLALGEDFFFGAPLDLAPKLDAPLVFVGYGMKVPEKNYDDLAGLDLKGKVAVIMPGLPEGISGPLAAHYLATPQRWKHLRDAGLIGWIVIMDLAGRWSPVSQLTAQLAGDEFNETRGQQIMMGFNLAHADRLFEGTGHTAAEFAFSAHIDGQGANGNSILPGALDNASGCAVLLDIAAELKRTGARTGRTLLFVFFTGEESYGLGSKYFTAHPTVDPKSIVANLNLDNIHAFLPLKALLVSGLDESDMGDATRRAAASQNIPMATDPEPELNRFTGSSDQYNFIVHGIPAVLPNVGYPGELFAVLLQWRRDRYHKPSDDLQQPVNLETAGKFEDFVLQLLLDVANDPHRPHWKSDSFYKRYAAM